MNKHRTGQSAAPIRPFPETPSAIKHHLRIIDDTAPAISLRDYFAGQALAGMLANQHTRPYANAWMATVACMCYEMADKMILASEVDEE